MFPRKCPQRKACTFGVIHVKRPQNVVFDHIHSNQTLINLTLFDNRLCASRPYRAREALKFRSYLGLKTQKRGFSAYSLKLNFNKLNTFR